LVNWFIAFKTPAELSFAVTFTVNPELIKTVFFLVPFEVPST
jgi:hypothetical protein